MLINKKINLVILALIFVVIFTLSGLAAPEYVVKMHHGLPVGHYLDESHRLWAEKVWEKSGGRVKIEIYPAGQLYSDKNVVQAVMAGAIESCWDYDHKFFTVIPAIGGMGLPACALTDPDISNNIRLIEAMQDAFYEGKGPGALLAKKFEEKGLKLIHFIFWSEPGWGLASKGKIIIKPEDLKGRKIRVMTSGGAKMYRSVGADSVSLSGSEMYEAMSRGTINAAQLTMVHLEERKLKEVIDYISIPIMPFNCIGVVVLNLNYWNKLPKDIQQILLEAGKEADIERRGVLAEISRGYREKIEKEGKVEFIDLTPEQTKVWSILAEKFRAKEAIELGPDAVEMWNSCQDFKKDFGMKPYPYIEK